MTSGKMNIGFFIETHQPGVGLFHVVDSMARHLSESANVYIFTTAFNDQKSTDDYPYQVIRHLSFKIPFLSIDWPLRFFDFKFNKKLKEANLDVIHIHSAHTIGMMGIQYGTKHHIHIIGTLNGLINQNAWNPSSNSLYTEKDIEEIKHAYHQCQLIFSSYRLTDTVLEQDDQMKKPVILPLGTDLTEKIQDQVLTELRQKHGIKADEKVFFSVNYKHIPSHLEWIADGMFKLRLKGYKFKWILWDQTDDSESLKNQIKKNGLLPYCIFIQEQVSKDQYQSYLRLSDLVCHASLLDPSYTVIVDAASQKKAVLMVSETPVSRWVTDQVNGYVSIQSPSVYAEKIMDILKYPKVLQKVSEKAYQDFYRTWHDLTQLQIEAYEQAILHNKQTP